MGPCFQLPGVSDSVTSRSLPNFCWGQNAGQHNTLHCNESSCSKTDVGLTTTLQGRKNSFACTISMFVVGFCDIVVGASMSQEEEEATLATREKQLLLLGPLLDFRKVKTLK